MDENEKLYNYYRSMYDSFAGNPEMQNKVVTQMYDYFSPDAISQRKQQADFMNLLYGNTGTDTSGGNTSSDFGNTPNGTLNNMGINEGNIDAKLDLNPKYSDAVKTSILGAYNAKPQGGTNFDGIDDNAMYEIPDDMLNVQQKNKTEQAIGDISKSYAPGQQAVFGLPFRFGMKLGGNEEKVKNFLDWNNAQNYKIGNTTFGGAFDTINKDAPFIGDIIKRYGDVANNFTGIKSLPGYL